METKEISKLKMAKLKNFIEFTEIKQGDLLISIEYCTDCKNHQWTTRHDEEKYLNTAKKVRDELLNQFPSIKVYLKPLKIEHGKKDIMSKFDRSRLGSFEIQLISYQETLEEELLFSKLKTGTWPDISKVLNQVRTYMPKSRIVVNLQIQGFTQDNLSPQDQDSLLKNKLLNIEVFLNPSHGTNDQKLHFQTSKSILSRPQSGFSKGRPISAISTKSNKSLQRKKSKAKMIEEKKPSDSTNKLGVVTFYNQPNELYLLEIKDTKDHKGASFEIDTRFNKNNETSHFTFTLQKNPSCFLTIRVTNDELKPVTDCIIEINGPNKYMVVEQFSREFNIKIQPDTYNITIKKKGLETLAQKNYYCEFGVQLLEFQLRTLDEEEARVQEEEIREQQQQMFQSQKQQEQEQQYIQEEEDQVYIDQKTIQQNTIHQNTINEHTINQRAIEEEVQEPVVQQKKPRPQSALQNVTIQLLDQLSTLPITNCNVQLKSSNKQQSFKSDQDGMISLPLVHEIGELAFFHEEYINKIERFNETGSETEPRSTIYLNEKGQFKLNLIQKIEENCMQIIINQQGYQNIVSMNVICPENSEISNEDIVIYNNEENNGILLFQMSNITNYNEIVRIFAMINDRDQFNDQYLQAYLVQGSVMQEISIPIFIDEESVAWDFGALLTNQNKFIFMNALSNSEMNETKMLQEYFELYKQIKDKSSKEIKKYFGFKSDYATLYDIQSAVQNNNYQSPDLIPYLFGRVRHPNGQFSLQGVIQITREMKNNNIQLEDEDEEAKYGDDFNE